MNTKQKTVLLFSICVIIIVGCSSSLDTINNDTFSEPGAEVFVVLKDGSEYDGELLYVRDDVMLLCERYYAREKDLTDSVFTIYILKNYDIKLIELKKGNYVIYGIIFGSLVGGVIGAGLYKSEEKKEEPKPGEFHFDLGLNFDPLAGCCIGGLIGAFAGGIIGYSIKDDEVVYECVDTQEYDFTQLNIYSRYGDKEPDYLMEIK